ncbi:N-acetylneuraminate synthase [Leptospira sp. 201903075]|uniref:N-acetylneuraminate synthase n=1 Tax=Leptospira chreensis TaxID=2810035 RepID=UPI0019637844|nr:N-acetylneuraminate synthase [Leptospira chreensis]MBM9589077.1 N-acetylneuraminate synthase [Leptospira chreensis]
MELKKHNTLIIAEAGVNHNGSIEIAKQMIDVASEAGADYVKFQTFISENLASRSAKKADYQTKTTNSDESQLAMLKKLELSHEVHYELIKYANSKNIKFLSTAFDLESLDFLQSLNIDLFKIPSGEITNFPYLRKVAQWKKPIILSTGMSSLGEIEDAIRVLEQYGIKRNGITVLHCNTEYPTPMSDVNLLAMNSIQKAFNVSVGYSDHTAGIEVAVAAVALGASVIEKHFTLDKNMEGPDHKASLEPGELKNLIKSIRNIEQALGDGIKKPSLSEMKNIEVARKSIVASKLIQKGEVFTDENCTTKRPAIGISPMKWESVIGKVATETFQPDDLIR